MKTKHLILTSALLLAPFAVFAQDTNAVNIITNTLPNQSDSAVKEDASKLVNDLFLILVTVVTPMLVRFGRWALPFVKDWFLPVLAPLLTLAANTISDFAGGPSVSPLVAALLGAAGVGIREIKDQVGWRMTATKAEVAAPEKSDTKNLGITRNIMLLAVSGMLVTSSGCAWFNPQGVEQVAPAEGQDLVVINSERIQETSLFAYERMINWELQNRAILPVEVSRAVDQARKEFLPLWKESRKALEAYKLTRGTDLSGINRLNAALSAAQSSFLTLTGKGEEVGGIFTALKQLSDAVNQLRQ